MKKFYLTILLVLLACKLNAQDNNTFEQSYESFKNAAIQKYVDFRRKANEQYAAFLKEAWKQSKILPKVQLPKDEETPPVEYDGQQKGNNKSIELDGVIEQTTPQPQPKPISAVPESDKNQQYYTFSFYGTEMKVRFDPSLVERINKIDGAHLGEAWAKMSTDRYNNVIRDCLELRIRYKLCDWAYYKMLEALSESVCGGKGNDAVLLQAYLYAQSGYKMRLATSNGKLLLMFNSNNLLFDYGGLKLDDGYFYTTEKLKEAEELNICDAPFPNESPMSMDIINEPILSDNFSQERTIKAQSCPIETKCKVNKNLIAFFNDYPTSYSDDNFLTRWRYYANTPLSESVKLELYPQLKSSLRDKDLLTAANMLLNYIQIGFEYEYDDKVWGHDRAFFAEETLYYPYCDCEDRAILYSRLVRDLLGLDVVLVYYPGHMCTAVNFPYGAHGDYIMLDGKPFTVSDPTYIGAPVGATMPGMDNKGAKVILLKK